MGDIGLRLPRGSSVETAIAHGERAEAAGVSSIWVAESWGRNSVPVMTHLLEHTTEPDVCAGIFNIFSRSPGLVAMTARGLCDMYGERLRIGLGTSAKPVVEAFHGSEFVAPLRRTREYIEIIDTLLAGKKLEYSGRFFDLSGFTLRGLDEPYSVPIYNAAMGETNRKLTGEFADGWLPLLFPVSRFEAAVDALEAGAAAGDRSLEDVTIAPYVPTCVSDEEPAACEDHVRGLLARYIGGMGDYYHRTISGYGYADTADAIRAAWEAEEYDRAKANVSDSLLADCSITGTVDAARETFTRYYDAGVDEPIAYVPPRAPEGLVRKTVENLADIS